LLSDNTIISFTLRIIFIIIYAISEILSNIVELCIKDVAAFGITIIFSYFKKYHLLFIKKKWDNFILSYFIIINFLNVILSVYPNFF